MKKLEEMVPLTVSDHMNCSPMGPSATDIAARSTLQIMASSAERPTTVFQSAATSWSASAGSTSALTRTGGSGMSSGSMTATCAAGLAAFSLAAAAPAKAGVNSVRVKGHI